MHRIDSHHHLWRYNSSEYDWLEGKFEMLRRDFVPEDLTHVAQEAGVSGTVVVQARQSVQETAWLLQLAQSTPLILGVVGWLPLGAPDFPSFLENFSTERLLKGLRHVVQAEAPGFLDNVAFNAGIRALLGTGLTYDLLIFERQLQEATRFVDRHPNQIFILDHIAKPHILAGEWQPWAEGIRELAKRENIFCKLSGMVTEADPKHWSPAQLQPYLDTVLEAFTPARLMAGSDWPVLCACCTYQRWWSILAQWVAPLAQDEQANILGCTATRVYSLEAPTATAQNPMGVPA